MVNLAQASNSDLGSNVYNLHQTVNNFKNGIFVDLGVRGGTSSTILLADAVNLNNHVYGVDVTDKWLPPNFKNQDNYTFITGDSSTVGKYWDKEKADIVFFDTLHCKEQVLCELYYWSKHVKPNSVLIFHDAAWPTNLNDVYAGITWDRVDEAIKQFFNITDLNTNNDYIKSMLFPESYGMCFIRLKQEIIRPTNIDWKYVFERRNILINSFWNEENSKDLKIELKMMPDEN